MILKIIKSPKLILQSSTAKSGLIQLLGLSLFTWFIIIYNYYNWGGQAFPDYINYSTENIDTSQYFGEIVTWGLLARTDRLVYAISNLDLFYIILHLASLCFILWTTTLGTRVLAMAFVFETIFFPLILTTTIRVAPLQILLFAFILLVRQRRISSLSFGLLMLGIAYLCHDSGFFVALSALFALILKPIINIARKFRYKSNAIIFTIFMAIIVGCIYFSNYILVFFPNLDDFIAIRSTYLVGDESLPLVKLMYAFGYVALLFASTCYGPSGDTFLTVFNFVLGVCVVALLIIAPVAGIRLSFLSLTAMMACQSGLFAALTVRRVILLSPLLIGFTTFSLWRLLFR